VFATSDEYDSAAEIPLAVSVSDASDLSVLFLGNERVRVVELVAGFPGASPQDLFYSKILHSYKAVVI
jgi:hypothetical protein